MFGHHRFKFLATSAMFGFLVWFWMRAVPATPGVHLRQGLEDLEKSEYSKAEQHFRAELQLVAQQPIASEKLAMIFFLQKKNQNPIIIFKKLTLNLGQILSYAFFCQPPIKAP